VTFEHPKQVEFLAGLARSVQEHAEQLVVQLERAQMLAPLWPHTLTSDQHQQLVTRIDAIEDYVGELRKYMGLAK